MPIEKNTPSKPKLKAPTKQPPVVEPVTPEFGAVDTAALEYSRLASRQTAPGGTLNMPAYQGTRGLREMTMLQAQRQHGNAFVQRQLAVQREETDDNTPLETAGLGKQEELEGHGNLGESSTVQREGPGSTPPTTAPAAPATAPTATITLTVTPPTIVRSPEATISTNHGAVGIAGWCTPSYNVAATSRTATTVALTVTLGFTIELASEYTGDRLGVLSDHENGHVRLGERLARQHLETDLRNNLQALPNFSSLPPMQAHIVTATTAFTAAEGQESRAYDTADYPRMREAYFGVRTALATLAANSAPIQQMVNAIQAFNTYVTNLTGTSADETALENAAHGVVNARANLSQIDVQRLQYNPEFKTLVATAQSFLPGLREHISQTGSVNLHEIELTLGTFTWTATV